MPPPLPQGEPPADLRADDVKLRFTRFVPADAGRGLVPYYHFRILDASEADVGHINFRIGDTRHIQLSAGHIGFQVKEEFRGHGYARKACRALAPFVRGIYKEVIITCDPTNEASRKTIESLGAIFLEEIALPPDDPQYLSGSRAKKRYRWAP